MICSPNFVSAKNNSICNFQCHPNRSYYCPNKCQSQCYIPPPIKCNSFILNCTPCNKFPHPKQSCNWWKHICIKPKIDACKIPEICFPSRISPKSSINCKIQCPMKYNQEIPSFTHEQKRLNDKREVKNFSSAKKPPSDQKYTSTKEKPIFQTPSILSTEFQVSEQHFKKYEGELKPILEITEEIAYRDKLKNRLHGKKNEKQERKRETKTENSYTRSSNTQRTTSISKDKIGNNSPRKDLRKSKPGIREINSEKSKPKRETFTSSSMRSSQSKTRPKVQSSVVKTTKDYRQQVKHERIMHTFEKHRATSEDSRKQQIQPKNNQKPRNNPKGQIQPKNNQKLRNNPNRQIQPKSVQKRQKVIQSFQSKGKPNKVILSAFGSSYGSDKMKSQNCFKQSDFKCKPFNMEFRPISTKFCSNLTTLPNLNPNLVCRNISYSCLPVKCKPIENNTQFRDKCINRNPAAYLCNLNRYNIPLYPKNPICKPLNLTGIQCANPLNNKYCTSIIKGPYLHLNK